MLTQAKHNKIYTPSSTGPGANRREAWEREIDVCQLKQCLWALCATLHMHMHEKLHLHLHLELLFSKKAFSFSHSSFVLRLDCQFTDTNEGQRVKNQTELNIKIKFCLWSVMTFLWTDNLTVSNFEFDKAGWDFNLVLVENKSISSSIELKSTWAPCQVSNVNLLLTVSATTDIQYCSQMVWGREGPIFHHKSNYKQNYTHLDSRIFFPVIITWPLRFLLTLQRKPRPLVAKHSY